MREELLRIKEELRVKLDTYDVIIRRLQFEKMNLWQQQMVNQWELQKLDAEEKKHGRSSNEPVSGTERD